MIPSKPTFLHWAPAPMRFATATPMSMSEPTGFEPWRDSSGGYVGSVQKTIVPALATPCSGATAPPAATAPTSAAATRAPSVTLKRTCMSCLLDRMADRSSVPQPGCGHVATSLHEVDLGVVGASGGSAPVAIAAHGGIVGTSTVRPKERHHGFLWIRGKLTDLGNIGDESYVAPRALNDYLCADDLRVLPRVDRWSH